MEEKLYTPQEVADLLKIKKTTVYDMIKKGKLQAVKMGKQFRISNCDLQKLFSVKEKVPRVTQNDLTENIVVCGQDMVLDVLCQQANESLKTNCFVRSYQGSYNGLLALYQEKVQLATAHLWDRQTNTYNLPFIKYMLPGEPVKVFHILNRPVYLYIKKGNPKKISSIKDLQRKEVVFANREKGSGIRVLTDSLLEEAGINIEDVSGYQNVATSHLIAAAMVANGDADCAFGNASAAAQFSDIEKIFVRYEQYDLILPTRLEGKEEIQEFLRILQSSKFRNEISRMGEYDVTDMGKQIL